MKISKVLFIFSLVCLGLGARAQQEQKILGPVATFEISPRQETYYVGQKVMATLTVDSRDVEFSSNLHIDGIPDANTIGELRFQQITGDNPRILKYRSDFILLRHGRIEFRPVVTGQVAVRVGSGFVVKRRIYDFTAGAEPVSLDIRVLPLETRPDDYSGAVGQFTLNASITPSDCYVGDLVNLRWVLQGEGSMNITPDVKYAPGAGFRIYPPRILERRDDSVTCEQVLIPLGTNVTVAAPLSVSYFDPLKAEYTTLRTPGFGLRVMERPAGLPPSTNEVMKLVVVPTTAEPRAKTAANGQSGLGFMRFLRRSHGEDQVMALSSTARLCPDNTSKTLFDVPAGATVVVRETAGNWRRVLYNGASGWVPQASLKKYID